MTSINKSKKALKKQRRCQTLIMKDFDIHSSEVPTKFLGICNAGLSTGLSYEAVLHGASAFGKVNQIIMVPGKSYCFLDCNNTQESKNIFLGMHNKSKLGQNNSVLIMSYFESVPDIENAWRKDLPKGCILIKEFVNENEEKVLLKAVNDCSSDNNIPLETAILKHRIVKHFGYEFIYDNNLLDLGNPLKQKIPKECDKLWPRLKDPLNKTGCTWNVPDQLTVNVYMPGQGIPPHIDTHSAFQDPILVLSLESNIVMDFRKGVKKVSIILPRRSLLILSDESRYDWSHGITPRYMDVIPTNNGTLTTVLRSKRTSLTFRKVRIGSCDCQFPKNCNTRRITPNSEVNTSLENLASKVEELNVHEVYEKIADHFSQTRHSPWPHVSEFIHSFPIGSILVDIGCGNGKYLSENQNIFQIGCDRSKNLLNICLRNQEKIFKCDCLHLPIRSNSVDGCISIAVLHHLASEERRIRALREMSRILHAGGLALIYVWAKNQRADLKKSSYLLQNKSLNKNKSTLEEQRLFTANQEFNIHSVTLPVHTNRTEFEQQDLFVPWKLKSITSENTTFLRYYHVFEKNELEYLCTRIENIDIVKSYYDQGNYCVLFKKL